MYTNKTSFSYDELIKCAKGELFGEGNPQLPMPPLLMFDRITHITEEGGEFDRGHITAELDIKPDLWFFKSHFINDPVMPGCLGLDALWQLIGFFLGKSGYNGKGRALGLEQLKFSGEILPTCKMVTYEIHIRRLVTHPMVIGVGNGSVAFDGNVVYKATNLKVGLKNINK